jgi:hemerythrin-like domain-containing protein
MIEHRLIEQAIEKMKEEKTRLETGGELDPILIDTMADFIKTYADRTHHGKEEDILFEDLTGRPLSGEEKKVMDELVEEHKYGRKLTKQLLEAKDTALGGSRKDVEAVASVMQKLIEFYPQHIKKEDDHFFPETERHYSKQELDDMVTRFYAFDRGMIHEKYQKLVDSLE